MALLLMFVVLVIVTAAVTVIVARHARWAREAPADEEWINILKSWNQRFKQDGR
jgi:threonine/homoserine/homoserine lactone efflux protein